MKKLLLAGAALAALSASAQAADLAAPRMPIAAAVVAPAFSWTGFYGGLNIGLGVVNTNLSALTAGDLASSATALVAGGQVGFNYQINNIVVGIEGDLGYFGTRRTGAQINLGAITAQNFWRTSWDASIRARLGLAMDRTLFYVTGGVAFADLRVGAMDITNNVLLVEERQNRTGWIVGAGIEHAITANWTVRGEYLYANYGTRDVAAFALAPIRMETHKFRVGVNYLFSTGPSAVVARY